MSVADVLRLSRWRATAETWFAKTCALLRVAPPNRHWETFAGYEAATLLLSVLSDAESLVGIVDAGQVEDVERRARRLADALRRRRLAAQLDDTTGRTPEEAAAYAAKAAELRR